jgi:hypothetical protein
MRKPGRPVGTACEWRKRRTTCRTCDEVLTEGDPTKMTKYGERYQGICRRCASDIKVLRLWGRRTKEETAYEIKRLTHIIRLLEKL